MDSGRVKPKGVALPFFFVDGNIFTSGCKNPIKDYLKYHLLSIFVVKIFSK